MNTAVKVGLLGFAAYLLYTRGLFDRILSSSPAPNPAVPSGGGRAVPTPVTYTPVGTPTGATGGGGATTIPTPSAPTQAPGALVYTREQIEAMLPQAAAGDRVAAAILDGLGIVFNGHQWNWYRERAGNPPAPGTEGLDAIFTASQYLNYRAGLGLSGLEGWL